MFKPVARADGLLRLVNNLYALRPLRSLTQCGRVMGAARPGVDYIARLMFKWGWQRRETIDRITDAWPADDWLANVIDDKVGLLTPFDPVVWDHIRFKHFWAGGTALRATRHW